MTTSIDEDEELLEEVIAAMGQFMHRAKQRKLSDADRYEMIRSIRERAKTHMLTCVVNDALYNLKPVDPLSALDDVALIALDATMDRAIVCLARGDMLEDKKILKNNTLYSYD